MSTIFISHSSADNALATELFNWLKDQGYRSVFLDLDPDDGIEAGERWEKVLYRELVSCSVVLALVTENWLTSQWCFAEATHARSGGKTILGLLASRGVQPAILADTQLIDYSPDLRTHAYQRLAEALRKAIDPQGLGRWDPARPLFPGLLFFDEQDAPIFFGRRRLGRAIYQKLRELQAKPSGSERLLLIFGPSGSGKSSLVRAGTLPHIHANPETWITLGPFRPTEGWPEPLRRYLDVLAESDEATVADRLRAIAGQLRGEGETSKATILLIIDQLEEALDAQDGAESEFWLPLSRLLAPNDTPFTVMATLRSDFMGDFQKRSARHAVRFASSPIEPMAPEDLREVVAGPCRVAGIPIEPGLIDALVEDAGDELALPLLALVLNRLWLRYEANEGRFTATDYLNGLGGMRGLIDREAESTLTGNGMREAVVLDAFLNLTRLAREGVLARNPANWNTLEPEARNALEPFVDARLLVRHSSEKQEHGEAGEIEIVTVELIHEALLIGWKRLHNWLAQTENRNFLLWREELRNKVDRWANAENKNPLLIAGSELYEAKKWLAAKRIALNAREAMYIQASLDASKISKTRYAIAALVLASVAVGGWAWTQTDIYQIRKIEEQVPELMRIASASESGDLHKTKFYQLVQIGRAELAINAADKIEDTTKKEDALREIAKALAETGQAERALAATDKIDSTTKQAEVLREVAKALADAGLVEQTLAALNKSGNPTKKAEILRNLAKALAYAGQVEQALSVTDKIYDLERKTNTLREMAKALADGGQVQPALTTVDKIGNPTKKAEALGEVARALADAGQVEQALAAADRIGNPAKKAEALRETAKALADAGKVEQALAAADLIGRPAKRTEALADLADGLADAKQDELAIRAWNNALAAADKIEEADMKTRAIGRLIERLGHDRQAQLMIRDGQIQLTVRAWMHGLAAADEIEDAETRATALGDLVSRLVRVAWHLGAGAGQMEPAPVAADKVDGPGKKAESLADLAGGQADAELVLLATQTGERALAVTEDEYENGDQSKVLAFGGVAQVFAATGLTQLAVQAGERALAAADKIEDTEEKADVFVDLAKTLTSSRQTRLADQACKRALAAADQIEDSETRDEAFAAVAEALASAGQTEQALIAADKIEDSYTETDALETAAKILAGAGQVRQALAAVEKIKGAESKAEALSEVATVLARAGQTKLALIAADKIEDSEMKAEAFQAVAEALAGAGQAEQALNVANKIEDSFTRPEAIKVVAKALAGAGHAEQALAAADKIKDADTKAKAFASVAQVLADAGQVPLAAQVWERALTIADKMQYTRGETLRDLAKGLTAISTALAGSGQTQLAAQSWEHALVAADKIVDSKIKTEVLENFAKGLTGVAETLAGAGQAEQALEAVDKIKDAKTKTEALLTVAKALAKTGQAEQALATVDKIEDADKKAAGLGSVARDLADAGQVQPATQGWERALTAIDEITHRAKRSETLLALAKEMASVSNALANAGQSELAAQIWERSLAAADAIEYAGRKAEVLQLTAGALTNLGLTKRAEAVLDNGLRATQGISDEKEKSRIYGNIASVYVQLGEYRLAREIAEEADFATDTLNAYLAILKYYAIEKQPELTEKLARLENEESR